MKRHSVARVCLVALMMAGCIAAQAQETTNDIAYLGVGTEPIDPVSAKQLKITRGMGLVVMHIDKDSIAAKNLQEYDILLKIDDQMLFNQPQLASLIQAKAPEDEVSLEIMREGKRETIKITLGKRKQVAARMHMRGHWPNIDLQSPKIQTLFMGPDGPMDADSMEEALKELLSRNDRLFGNVTNILKTTIELDVDDMDGNSHTMTFGSSTLTMTMIDSEAGATATLSESDGKQTLVMKDLDGTVVHEGPVTDKTREELPKQYRDLFDRLKKMRAKTDVKTGTHFESSTPGGVSM